MHTPRRSSLSAGGCMTRPSTAGLKREITKPSSRRTTWSVKTDVGCVVLEVSFPNRVAGGKSRQ